MKFEAYVNRLLWADKLNSWPSAELAKSEKLSDRSAINLEWPFSNSMIYFL